MLKSNFFSKNKYKQINKKKEKKSQTFSKRGYKFVKSFFRLFLGISFQRQPPEVFFRNRRSEKFRKVHRKTKGLSLQLY